jgi:hypothetical protein
MIYILLILFGPFIEFFLWSTGLGSLFFAIVFSLLAYQRISTKYLIGIIIFSVIADVGLGLQFGITIGAILSGAITLMVLNLFMASHDKLLNSISLGISILVGFAMVGFLHGSLDWGFVIRNSIFTLIWAFIFNYFTSQRFDSIKFSSRAR